MQRSVIIAAAEHMGAKSLSTLFPVERHLKDLAEDHRSSEISFDLVVAVALVQQIEALRLTVMALLAPEDS